MKYLIILTFFAQTLYAQSYTGTNQPSIQKENTDRAIEQNRKEINPPSTELKVKNTTVNSNTWDLSNDYQINQDSAVVGIYLNEGSSNFTGFKITKLFAFSYMKENSGQRSRLQIGFEAPGDVDKHGLNVILGGGLQLNTKNETPKLTLYANGGLDHHLTSLIKAQYMAQYVLGGNFGLMLGLGLEF